MGKKLLVILSVVVLASNLLCFASVSNNVESTNQIQLCDKAGLIVNLPVKL
ncbi:hypothetical protein [Lachnoclostridium sp.]|uniref:hypothetical protein n=1 Tax=Lachnoclostridium sp. TaxID=2028282 RepID=UPI00289F112E|nr:hypothetical protein [Lachnoclostridium sp.]